MPWLSTPHFSPDLPPTPGPAGAAIKPDSVAAVATAADAVAPATGAAAASWPADEAGRGPTTEQAQNQEKAHIQAQEQIQEQALDRRLAKFDVLLGDIRHPPTVELVDVGAYSGLAGEVIRVIARDDFAVVRVVVRLTQADGTLVEEGEATKQLNPLEWLYRTRQTNAAFAGGTLTVRAFDRPGNEAEQLQPL